MNRTLGERHIVLADHTRTSRNMRTSTLIDSIARTWTRPMSDSSREFCDFASAVSGDDLARIAAFEPKREPSLWADVTTHGLEAAA